MAKSNRDRVADVLDALKEGLGPYVLNAFSQNYGEHFLAEVGVALKTESYSAKPLTTVHAALAEIDLHGWLSVMERRWNEVFRSRLGKAERSYVGELKEGRNDWAHQRSFTPTDAYRLADTAMRLLAAVNAPTQMQQVSDIGADLLRLRQEAEQKQVQKATAALADAPRHLPAGLLPWREVVHPHHDVVTGRYLQAEFAADLAQVVQGRANDVYGDPREFFRRTYLTDGLAQLLANGLRRLSGQGGEPVVQLQTSFGGGKTHSMIAVYHLFGTTRVADIPGGEAITSLTGHMDDVEARRAVIVGTAFSATEPRMYPTVTTRTVWGEIAYQLGGAEAYRLVETADLHGVSPGSDTLVQLFEQFGPALVIIDELVAFARNLPVTGDNVPAGNFESLMTFIQALTEAARRSTDAMVLISVPESDIEKGGERGQEATEFLAKTVGRMESVWRPVTATESFGIVRRRLFGDAINYAARDAVVAAFSQMYQQHRNEFPASLVEGDYRQRLQDAYPIHPEMFDRLYQDWSTLDRFQRTRGVLRHLAAVIHQLWQDNDKSLLIMPGSVPLWASRVRDDLLRYLPFEYNWTAIVDTDVDGQQSRPFQIDKDVTSLGQHTAARRVARALFMGSAPSITGQSARGMDEARVRLATAMPGEPLAVFGDALRRMSNQLTYLYSDGNRYWYDVRATVNREAEERARKIDGEVVLQEAVARLRAIRFKREDFNAAHVAPQSSGDVVDEPRTRVVVLGPQHAHKRNDDKSAAMTFATETLQSRGSSPRLYQNMLVFIAADVAEAEAWGSALRDHLAWKSINEDAEQLVLNLDAQQRKQVITNLRRTEETVQARLLETYQWLLVPVQDDPLKPVRIEAHRITTGQDNFYDRAARALRQSEMLITRWSPGHLLIELDRSLWRNQPHASIRQLWDDLARYCYLPRLFNLHVLLQAVSDGVGRLDATFAYATGLEDDGSYAGLALREQIGRPHFDGSDVVVRVDVAEQQLGTPPSIAEPTGHNSDGGTAGGSIGDTGSAGSITVKRKTRYHGSVTLDPLRVNEQMAQIVDEILQHLTGLAGTQVEVKLEISARRTAGFDDVTMRNVSENSRTLKFKHQSFEAD